MEAAITAVCVDRVSISEAARLHDVPRKTLSDRVNQKHGKSVGRPTLLLPEEENSLLEYIFYMQDHAFPLSVRQIRNYAWAIALRSQRGSFQKVALVTTGGASFESVIRISSR